MLALLVLLTSWLPPIPGAQPAHAYAAPAQTWASGHRGVDYAALPGTPVRAIGDGMVAFAGQVAGKPVVSVDHPSTGLRSTYEPVVAVVHAGEQVRAGQLIGLTAEIGGHCAGSCLHLGVREAQSRDYRDPLLLLGSGFAVLRPLDR